jgi:hypothetical protein
MNMFLRQLKFEILMHLRAAEVVLWGFVFPILMIVVLGFVF